MLQLVKPVFGGQGYLPTGVVELHCAFICLIHKKAISRYSPNSVINSDQSNSIYRIGIPAKPK